MIDSAALRALRKQLGESQTEFGARFGVSQGEISRWERLGINVAPGMSWIGFESILSGIMDKVAPQTPPEAPTEPLSASGIEVADEDLPQP